MRYILLFVCLVNCVYASSSEQLIQKKLEESECKLRELEEYSTDYWFEFGKYHAYRDCLKIVRYDYD